MQSRPVRKKPNQVEINKKIDSDFRRKYSYFVPDDNSEHFTAPEENHLNRMLGHSKPFTKVDADGLISADGEYGQVRHFYIPKQEYEKVLRLLKDFKIPEKMHQDLIWAYLNMFISACEATFHNNFHAEHEKDQKELFETLDFLKALTDKKTGLRSISLEYSDRLPSTANGNRNLGPPKNKRIKGTAAISLIEKVLQSCQNAKDYSVFESIYDTRKKYGKADMFMGYKNHEKHHQSFYSSSLFNYLRNGLFSDLFDLLSDEKKYVVELKRLKKLYSRRKMFLFIGKLMGLSGLLLMKPGAIDDDIIENIEKKLTPKLRSEKRKQQEIKEHNKNPTDGMIGIQMFDELF